MTLVLHVYVTCGVTDLWWLTSGLDGPRGIGRIPSRASPPLVTQPEGQRENWLPVTNTASGDLNPTGSGLAVRPPDPSFRTSPCIHSLKTPSVSQRTSCDDSALSPRPEVCHGLLTATSHLVCPDCQCPCCSHTLTPVPHLPPLPTHPSYLSSMERACRNSRNRLEVELLLRLQFGPWNPGSEEAPRWGMTYERRGLGEIQWLDRTDSTSGTFDAFPPSLSGQSPLSLNSSF